MRFGGERDEGRGDISWVRRVLTSANPEGGVGNGSKSCNGRDKNETWKGPEEEDISEKLRATVRSVLMEMGEL